MCLCLLLFFGALSVGVKAADPPPQPVGPVFDSSYSNVELLGGSMADFINGGINYGPVRAWRQYPIDLLPVNTLLWPSGSYVVTVGKASKVLFAGNGADIGDGLGAGLVYFRTKFEPNRGLMAAYSIPLSQYNLVPGKSYRFYIEEIYGFSGIVPQPFGGALTARIEVNAGIVDGEGNNYAVSDVIVPSDSYYPWFEITHDDEELTGLYFNFVPDNMYTSMTLVVAVMVDLTWPSANNYVGQSPFVGFQGATIIEIPGPPDPDEEFRDEQRGFWAKLLAMLQGIVDTIKSIGEWFANINEWIKHLVVPDDEVIQGIVDEFNEYVKGKLGFVHQISTLLQDIFKPLIDGFGEGEVILTLPKAELPESYGGTVFWEDTGLNISDMISTNERLAFLYGAYKAFASVLLIGLLLRYLRRVAANVMGDNGLAVEEAVETGLEMANGG